MVTKEEHIKIHLGDHYKKHVKKYRKPHVPFICLETNKIYTSQAGCAKELHVPPASIWLVLNGRMKQTHRLSFSIFKGEYLMEITEKLNERLQKSSLVVYKLSDLAKKLKVKKEILKEFLETKGFQKYSESRYYVKIK